MRRINIHHLILIIGIALLNCAACSNSIEIDPKIEKNKILELLQAERKYHVEEMANELVNMQSDDFTSINAGEVSKPSKEEGKEMFSNYFSAVEFEAWDDMDEPTIKFSDDYSVAYVTVKKKVVAKFTGKNGKELKEDSEFAWVAIYRKSDNIWEMDLIASTNKPRGAI